MKIYDISQEVFGCTVFPGDPQPERIVVSSMEEGALYNLTALHMCAHNGTHVDAPHHFINGGKKIDELDLYKLVGPCYVYAKDGELVAEEAEAVIKEAQKIDPECAKRLLFKGKAIVTEAAAKVFASHQISLVGNESQTVGPENAPMKVHLILLGQEIVLLEGIRLEKVPVGKYLLNAAPINLGGSDGAPCRAILYRTDDSI